MIHCQILPSSKSHLYAAEEQFAHNITSTQRNDNNVTDRLCWYMNPIINSFNISCYYYTIPVVCRAVSTTWSQKPLLTLAKPVNQELLRGTFLTTNFHTLTAKQTLTLSTNPAILSISNYLLQPQQTRNVTKFSLRNGRRKTVKAVLKRFKRLDWGGWIRTRAGRHKKIWKKSPALRNRLRQHVLVNATQAWLLDKMVTRYWRRPKYYINDPYAPYHKRESFFATYRTPLKY